jgi:pimeloyl-ACP methyl ester carboxylesterase
MAPISPEEWRARGAALTWRGHPMFYREEGAGEVVLLVHGFPTASWDWWAIWPQLAARYRVLAPDLYGFGFSAKPRRGGYNIGAQADLCEALLAHAGLAAGAEYRLVAHDYGVTVAQELLARQGAGARPRLRSVTLLNGGLFPEAHRPLLTQRLLASPVGPLVARLGGYRAFAAAMRRIWGVRPPDEVELQAMWRLVAAGGGPAVTAELIGYMAERRAQRARWVGALVEAAIPVRLIDGLADPVSGAHLVARYRELMPRPDVIELPGVGHYPQLEAPAAVAAAILDHLAGGGAP